MWSTNQTTNFSDNTTPITATTSDYTPFTFYQDDLNYLSDYQNYEFNVQDSEQAQQEYGIVNEYQQNYSTPGDIQYDDQKHKCQICGKSFSRPGYVKVHCKTVHLARKEYLCEYCG